MGLIDQVHPAASVFMWLFTLFFLCVFALPLLVVPLRWARWFRWPDSAVADNALTVYFGRCLGGVATALSVGWFQAAMHPATHRVVFEITIAAGLLMTLVHVRGALEKRQPWTENAEIPMYIAFTIAAFLIYRTL